MGALALGMKITRFRLCATEKRYRRAFPDDTLARTDSIYRPYTKSAQLAATKARLPDIRRIADVQGLVCSTYRYSHINQSIAVIGRLLRQVKAHTPSFFHEEREAFGVSTS